MSEPTRQVEDDVTRDPIVGKVATLLNERELVINIGTTAGVKPRMKFRVLAAAPVEVHDPDTNAFLGAIQREKVRVQATEVEENLAICRTYETLRRGSLRTASEMVAEGGVRTLRANDRGHIPALPERDSYVKRGDVVEEILE